MGANNWAAEFGVFLTCPNGMPKTPFMQWLIEQCDAGSFPPEEVREHRKSIHEWGCIDPPVNWDEWGCHQTF